MERTCLDCGTILRGRSDKKFCDDQCRSNYNNQAKAGAYMMMRPVNTILRRNYAILSKLCLGEKTKIGKEELLQNGFNPTYHTHLYKTQNGHTYYFCYEYGYLLLDNEEVLLVKREEK